MAGTKLLLYGRNLQLVRGFSACAPNHIAGRCRIWAVSAYQKGRLARVHGRCRRGDSTGWTGIRSDYPERDGCWTRIQDYCVGSARRKEGGMPQCVEKIEQGQRPVGRCPCVGFSVDSPSRKSEAAISAWLERIRFCRRVISSFSPEIHIPETILVRATRTH